MEENKREFSGFNGTFTYLFQKYFSNCRIDAGCKVNLFKLDPNWIRHKNKWSKMLKEFYVTPLLDVDEFNKNMQFKDVELEEISQLELLSHGIGILKRKNRKSFYKLGLYSLENKFKFIVKKPQGLIIKYDSLNELFRLEGKFSGKYGVGKWFSQNEDVIVDKVIGVKTDFREYVNQEESRLESMFFNKDKSELVEIEEMPVLWNLKGEIICIPKEGDTKTIGCVGKKGYGKSFLLNRLIGMLKRHYKWKTEVAILNDCLDENYVFGMSPYCTTNNILNSIYNKDTFLYESLCALPTVNFYPYFDKVNKSISYNTNDVYLSLPYKEVIDNFSRYFDLKASAKYLYEIQSKLKECTTKEEIRKVIETLDFGKNSKSVHNAILANINRLWDQKLLDVSNNIDSKWRVYNKDNELIGEYNPIVACLAAGLIPILVTSQILNKEWFDEYFRYFIENIFNNQSQDPYFRQNNLEIYLVIDELLNVACRGKQEKTETGKAVIRCVTEGRPKRLGTIWATQNYSKVPDRIQTNTNYLFTTLNQEANLIVSVYDLPKSYISKIKNLKRFEMCGVTDSKWVIYDSDGNRRETDEPVFGYSIPPLNLHKKPLI